eukprot:7167922-Prymnesium_polylepis.2
MYVCGLRMRRGDTHGPSRHTAPAPDAAVRSRCQRRPKPAAQRARRGTAATLVRGVTYFQSPSVSPTLQPQASIAGFNRRLQAHASAPRFKPRRQSQASSPRFSPRRRRLTCGLCGSIARAAHHSSGCSRASNACHIRVGARAILGWVQQSEQRLPSVEPRERRSAVRGASRRESRRGGRRGWPGCGCAVGQACGRGRGRLGRGCAVGQGA